MFHVLKIMLNLNNHLITHFIYEHNGRQHRESNIRKSNIRKSNIAKREHAKTINTSSGAVYRLHRHPEAKATPILIPVCIACECTGVNACVFLWEVRRVANVKAQGLLVPRTVCTLVSSYLGFPPNERFYILSCELFCVLISRFELKRTVLFTES